MERTLDAGTTGTGSDEKSAGEAGVRVVVLSLPEDEGEGLGFRLTRTLWDPYPWVREVVAGSRAAGAGLRVGDCLLQACGQDLLGLPVGQVAGLIRGDGAGGSVTLVAWNCGVDPTDDPELLWSCGGGARGERARRALTGVVKALACAVCAATATKPLSCARSHLYCEPCWLRLQRCALCREALPPKDSPYAKNMVAEQVDSRPAHQVTQNQYKLSYTTTQYPYKVFEAIASEYEIKDAIRKPGASVSHTASPSLSPSTHRNGPYQISMMNRKKTVQFKNKFGQNYASDPNIHRSTNTDSTTNLVENSATGNTEISVKSCNCQTDSKSSKIKIQVENVEEIVQSNVKCCKNTLQHRLVAQLRQACSLADLQNAPQSCQCTLTRSLNNINANDPSHSIHRHVSSGNIKAHSCCNIAESASAPLVFLSVPPICVIPCEHTTTATAHRSVPSS